MKNVTYINASAGSGKTYRLTHQLAELISDRKVKPDQIIMTTFTVKAANEMKEEAKKVLYEEGLFFILREKSLVFRVLFAQLPDLPGDRFLLLFTEGNDPQ